MSTEIATPIEKKRPVAKCPVCDQIHVFKTADEAVTALEKFHQKENATIALTINNRTIEASGSPRLVQHIVDRYLDYLRM